MVGEIVGLIALAAGLALIGHQAWRHSWHRCRLQIRRLPEHIRQHHDERV